MTPPPNLTKVEQTDEMRNVEQARQDEITAGTGVEDAAAEDHGTRAPNQNADNIDGETGTVRKTINHSPQDDMRAQIANRFKRGQQDVPFNGDMTDPEMQYGQFGRAPAEVPDEESSIVGEVQRSQPEQPEHQPARKLVKVRGQDMLLTDDEILAAAQKTLAADTYLEDAKKLLEEAKAIRAERAGQSPQHPEGRISTQDDGLDHDNTADQARHPAPDFKSVVEKIQYGDPEEAARDLEQIVDARVTKNVDESQVTRLFNNDLAKSQKALNDFRAANPELASDPKAHKVIEAEMYDLYKEDMVKLGIDPTQIPSDPRTLANWHRFYKINGYEVRSTPELLNKAKENFEAWKGVKPASQQPPRKEAPRVQVNVDRTDRRMNIPNQPTRAVVPRRDAVTVPEKTPGSQVVAQMRRARGQV